MAALLLVTLLGVAATASCTAARIVPDAVNHKGRSLTSVAPGFTGFTDTEDQGDGNYSTQTAWHLVQTAQRGKIVATTDYNGTLELRIMMKAANPVSQAFTDTPMYKAQSVNTTEWVYTSLNAMPHPRNAALMWKYAYNDDGMDEQVLRISLRKGLILREEEDGLVLQYWAAVLGEGDEDGSTSKTLANLHSGAKTEVPMQQITLFADFDEALPGLLRMGVAADIAKMYALANVALAVGQPEYASEITKYNNGDPRWAQTMTDYVAATVKYGGASNFAYRAAPSNTAYTYTLTTDTEFTLGLLSDWASGQPQAINMLSQMVSGFSPDAILHLGDTYYGGSASQFDDNMYKPVTQYAKGVQWYTTPGNHDYYNGGGPFYDTIDKFRSDGFTKQEASFFALEIGNWVVIVMDTGFHDSNPFSSDCTYLPDDQAEWVLAQVKSAQDAGKRIVFASHHQLFTPYEALCKVDGKGVAINPHLYEQLESVLGAPDIWFWGHEHNQATYEPYAGVKEAVLIGSGSIPVFLSQAPYTVNSNLQVVASDETSIPTPKPGMPQMTEAAYGYYYQHTFGVMKFSGSSATVEYYEIDWNCDMAEGCTWMSPPKKIGEDSL